MTATGDLIFPLMGTAASVGLARTLTAARLRNWGNYHIVDDALLIVSELVTNAAGRTPNREIRVQVSRDAHGVVIAVWDADPEHPRPKRLEELTLDVSEEAFDDNGGRGLHIVRALSAKCAVTRDPYGGKWVWARIIP